MKLTAILVLVACLQISAKTYSQVVTWSGRDASLEKLFSDIEKQTGYVFFFNYDELKNSKPVTLQVNKAKLKDVLNLVFSNQPLDYLIKKKTVFITKKPTATEDLPAVIPPPVEVKGKVVNEKGEPVVGATITVTGTKIGTAASADGGFTISVPDDKKTLTISAVGYEDFSLAIPASNKIFVRLKTKLEDYSDVVVVGYGSVKKSDLTGSISSVSRKDLGDRQVPDVASLLAGRAAGVDVSQGAIRVRGVTTFNNTDPMYVIDGVLGGNISTVNANDIERIEVLKDASSTAIYGSMGANGVILITTKSGKAGPLKVNVSAFTGISFTPKKLPVLNASQYVDYALDALKNSGTPPTAKLLSPEVRTDVTNWQDQVFRTARKHEVNVSFSGGSDKSSSYLALGYRYNEAITTDGPSNKDLYARLKNEYQIKPWLKAGINFGVAYDDSKGVSPWNLAYMLNIPPYLPVYDTSNIKGLGFADTDVQTDLNGVANPIAITKLFHSTGNSLNYQISGWAEVQPLKGLTYRVQASVSGNWGRTQDWNPTVVLGGSQQLQQSQLNKQEYYGYSPLIEQYLTYANRIRKHDFTIMGGTTWRNDNQGGRIGVYGTNFANMDVLNVISGGAGANGVKTDTYSYAASMAYFGRLNYAYANKYLLTFNFRADASPKFAPANRWGYFPSVAVAWKLHEENFIKDLNIFDQFKIRAGWGISGNDAIGDFMYLSNIFNTNVYYPLGTNQSRVNGATVMTNSSGNIKWESTESKTIGTDMTFLKNRLNLTAEYFIKSTNDILFPVPQPVSMGYGSNSVSGSPIVNAASCENKGFELVLGYQGNLGKLHYAVNANYTYIDNKVTSLGLGQPYLVPVPGSQVTTGVSRTDLNHPIGYFYGFIANGIFKTQAEVDAANQAARDAYTKQNPNASASDISSVYYQMSSTAPGDVKFKDLNGDGRVDYDKDRTSIGSPIPRHYFGFSLSLEYGGFDFNALLQGIAGSKIFNANYTGLRGGTQLWNQETYVLGRWESEQNPGNGIVPRAVIGDPSLNNRPSSLMVSSGDYLKVRQLSVGYTLPKSMVAHWGIDDLRFYISTYNLFTISGYSQGYDPDIAGQSSNLSRGFDNVNVFPNPKSVVFGIQVGL
ncbi:MAG TPA: TonB-dependent receptor [Puia sp.]|nr:TonB-dependent receptor [Puia sp.]